MVCEIVKEGVMIAQLYFYRDLCSLPKQLQNSNPVHGLCCTATCLNKPIQGSYR